MRLEDLAWDDKGLVTVVVQDRHEGDIRMVAFANLEALRATLKTGQAHFYSRSRRSLWRKGETSGHVLSVAEVWADCDGDALVYLVDPEGPSCHTGVRSCFFRRLDPESEEVVESESGVHLALPTLSRLWQRLQERTALGAAKSYTRSLLDAGLAHLAGKVEEESGEFNQALLEESDDRLRSEAADLFYHALVALMGRGLTGRAVLGELAARFTQSGHQEKASRSKGRSETS